MKSIFLSLSVAVLALGFSSCSKSSSSAPTTANVMFVNACTGTAAVSVAANGVTVPGGTNLAFMRNTGYDAVTAGTIKIAYSIVGSGITSALITGNPTLMVGSSYSVFVGGLFTAPSFLCIGDDLSAPAAGNAKVRFVNLSPDNINASCYIGNTKIDSNINNQGNSPYLQVAATTDKVTMLDPATPTISALLTGQTFTAGKIYTVVLTGSSSGTTSSAMLNLTIINNN